MAKIIFPDGTVQDYSSAGTTTSSRSTARPADHARPIGYHRATDHGEFTRASFNITIGVVRLWISDELPDLQAYDGILRIHQPHRFTNRLYRLRDYWRLNERQEQ